jgi:hypothetical protein
MQDSGYALRDSGKGEKKKITPFAMMLDRTRTPWTKARSQLNDGRIKLEPLVKCKKPGTV